LFAATVGVRAERRGWVTLSPHAANHIAPKAITCDTYRFIVRFSSRRFKSLDIHIAVSSSHDEHAFALPRAFEWCRGVVNARSTSKVPDDSHRHEQTLRDGNQRALAITGHGLELLW
jgi:hypothetical protein